MDILNFVRNQGWQPPVQDAFGEAVAHRFENFTGEQRASFLNHLLQAAPGGLANDLLGRFGGRKHATPEESESVQPEEVRKLVAEAGKIDPSFAGRVKQFFAGNGKSPG
jgi:hypothetical protein